MSTPTSTLSPANPVRDWPFTPLPEDQPVAWDPEKGVYILSRRHRGETEADGDRVVHLPRRYRPAPHPAQPSAAAQAAGEGFQTAVLQVLTGGLIGFALGVTALGAVLRSQGLL